MEPMTFTVGFIGVFLFYSFKNPKRSPGCDHRLKCLDTITDFQKETSDSLKINRVCCREKLFTPQTIVSCFHGQMCSITWQQSCNLHLHCFNTSSRTFGNKRGSVALLVSGGLQNSPQLSASPLAETLQMRGPTTIGTM